MWRSWCLRRIEWDASNSAKYYLVEIYYIVNQSGTNRHSTLMFSIYKKYYIHTYIPTTLLSTQLPSWVRYPKENSIISTTGYSVWIWNPLYYKYIHHDAPTYLDDPPILLYIFCEYSNIILLLNKWCWIIFKKSSSCYYFLIFTRIGSKNKFGWDHEKNEWP